MFLAKLVHSLTTALIVNSCCLVGDLKNTPLCPQRRSRCSESQEDIHKLEPLDRDILKPDVQSLMQNGRRCSRSPWMQGLKKCEGLWLHLGCPQGCQSRTYDYPKVRGLGERVALAQIVTCQKPLCWCHRSKIHSKSCPREWLVATRVESILQKIFSHPDNGTVVMATPFMIGTLNSLYNVRVFLGWPLVVVWKTWIYPFICEWESSPDKLSC